jgi:hypothetical protein
VSEINVAQPLCQKVLRPSSSPTLLYGAPSSVHQVGKESTCVVDHFPIKVSESDFNPRALRARGQLTRPHVRVVTQMLGDATPGFVRVSTRLRNYMNVF